MLKRIEKKDMTKFEFFQPDGQPTYLGLLFMRVFEKEVEEKLGIKLDEAIRRLKAS